MNRGLKAWGLAVVAAVTWISAEGADASARHHRHIAGNIHGNYIGVIRPGVVYSHKCHYAALVGDPGSGLGFYQLPLQYRIGAWRYRLRHAPAPWEVPPVIAAAQAQAVRYYGWVGPTPAEDYLYGVYNPIDGVGSPFFAGYYGPAGDDDEDHSSFPFGRPYPN